MQWIRKDNPNHDEKGRFSTGSGTPFNLDAALKSIAENHKVELDKVSEVNTLIEDLRKIGQEAKAAGTQAPNYNLCDVAVEGTNLFCADSKDIPRLDMPQLSGPPKEGSPAASLPKDSRGEVNIGEGFKKSLIAAGYGVTEETVKADSLKATQDELNGVKVAQIAQAIDQGKLDQASLFVSKDNYIVDGHHRWAAMVAVDSETGTLGHITVPIERVNLDIIPLLDLARKYARDQGIPQTSADDKVHKKDCGCMFKKAASWLRKDPGVAVDNDPPASPAIDGPGSSWRKLPEQKQTNLKKKRTPAFVVKPNASYPNPGLSKDDTSDGSEPSEVNSADGRPKWMQSPGQGGKEPVYRSQKPDGNKDTTFSKNVNQDPPAITPINPDSYLIW